MTTILVVDDTRENRDYLGSLLASVGYGVLTADSGAAGIELALEQKPDVIISDILMPKMDGFEFVRRIRLAPEIARTPVIFCSATYLEAEARSLARACGVNHLLVKPVEPSAALAAVNAALLSEPGTMAPARGFTRRHLSLISDKLSQKVSELKSANDHLERLIDELSRSNRALTQAYDATLKGWVRALDMRDHETEGHSQRVTELTVRLACLLGADDAELVRIRRGALLHDIGKLAVPDRILLKPGPLNADERRLMREHPTHARLMLEPIDYLRDSLEIPMHHHEMWNGAGYPQGLRHDEIPRSARMFSVVDVWDALHSDRPYRPAWPDAKVRQYIADEAGGQFDPDIVESFLGMIAAMDTGEGLGAAAS